VSSIWLAPSRTFATPPQEVSRDPPDTSTSKACETTNSDSRTKERQPSILLNWWPQICVQVVDGARTCSLKGEEQLGSLAAHAKDHSLGSADLCSRVRSLKTSSWCQSKSRSSSRSQCLCKTGCALRIFILVQRTSASRAHTLQSVVLVLDTNAKVWLSTVCKSRSRNRLAKSGSESRRQQLPSSRTAVQCY
jgi:hypothetical protein